jgi:hypothetical protein
MVGLLCLLALFPCSSQKVLAPPPVASRICVNNHAGFDLHWSLKDLNTNVVGPDSGYYPTHETRCQPIDHVPGVVSNHLVLTTVFADGFQTAHFPDSAVFYSSTSTNTANFTCIRTTQDYSCSLD